jgi:citrate synthase
VADSVTITDNRTGESIEIPIVDGGIASSEFSKLLPGVWFYDPAFSATALCRSAITFVDGEAGILEHRGYPIEQLAEQSSYLEVAYLLTHGELPTAAQLAAWNADIARHALIEEKFVERFVAGFHKGAHPMGMLVSAVAALSTFYPESKDIADPENRRLQVTRLIAKMPTLAAAVHRFSVGEEFVPPDETLPFGENFLTMMWDTGEPEFAVDPVLAHAIDVLFILHADHEQNCSTAALRVVGSAHADPYSACSAACAALYGPRHGGANEQVVKMLTEIGSIDNVGAFVKSVKESHGRIQGVGHRVYKHYDPRAAIIRQIAYDVFEISGKNPLLDVALKLEEAVLADEYFTSRRLYPNVDFYSGFIYQAMGFPPEMFTVLFALARTSGWVAHWAEMLDSNERIARPRQLYTGRRQRDYVPIGQRP